MITQNLQGIAEQVVRRAQRQGYVLPREVRDELETAGLSADLWKDVVALARPSLTYRKGRYYFVAPVSERVRQHQDMQRVIEKAIKGLIRAHRERHEGVERREEDRVDFVQPVKVTTEDGREYTLLSRDLSPSGIRLVGTRRFLGQKVRVELAVNGDPPVTFLARVLWTCPLGEDLVENGGQFLELVGGE